MKDEMDILREVSTTAAAHGSTALSSMLGKTIHIKLPVLGDMLDERHFLQKIKPSDIVLCVQFKVLSGLESKIILTFSEKSAYQLIGMCYEKKDDLISMGVFTEVGLSVIKEVSNIVVSAYCGALSVFLNTPVIPSPPILMSGQSGEIMKSLFEHNKKYVLMIGAEFEERGEKVHGGMEFAITDSDQQKLQNACKKMLESLKGHQP